MIAALFLLNAQGDVVIDMPLQKTVPRAYVEEYWAGVMARDDGAAPALAPYRDVVFAHVHRGELVLLAATHNEGAALVLFDELDLVARLLALYLKELSERTLLDNFSTVYQLLQEVFDYGYPLTTDAAVLQELVPAPTLENKVRSLVDASSSMLSHVARTAPAPSDVYTRFTGLSGGSGSGSGSGSTVQHRSYAYDGGSLPWRMAQPHRTSGQNELLFDVVEVVDGVVDARGVLTKATVRGVVEVTCHYGGMPDVLMRLGGGSDALDDVALHRCVRVARYANDRAISFVPPEGRFTLLQYMCKPDLLASRNGSSSSSSGGGGGGSMGSRLPAFYVSPQVTVSGAHGRFSCMAGMRGTRAHVQHQHQRYGHALPRAGGGGLAGASLDGEARVQRLVVQLLLPPTTTAVTVMQCTHGTTSFDRKRGTLTWSIGNLSATSTPSLSGELMLGDVAAAATTTTASARQQRGGSSSGDGAQASSGRCATGSTAALVSFELPGNTVSGVRVQSVQVYNDSAKSYTGVKYLTRAGNFVVRTA